MLTVDLGFFTHIKGDFVPDCRLVSPVVPQ